MSEDTRLINMAITRLRAVEKTLERVEDAAAKARVSRGEDARRMNLLIWGVAKIAEGQGLKWVHDRLTHPDALSWGEQEKRDADLRASQVVTDFERNYEV